MSRTGDGEPGPSEGSTRGAAALTTRRLALEPFALSQVDRLHALFLDDRVRRFLLDGRGVPREWVVDEVVRSGTRFESGSCGIWAILPMDSDHIIGFCGYRPFHEPPELQLVCGLAPRWWGRGLATEAAREVVRYGFEVAGMERIPADADVENAASVRLMERLGMRFLRRTVRSGLDTVCYVLDRREWQGVGG